MKRMHSGAGKRTFGLCMLMATLLSGPSVAKADPVLDWNVIAVDTAVANGQNPFAQARFAAIVQVAVFEAVNAITGDYRPYLGSIVAPHGASANAAAVQAAYRVLSTYFPASASTLDAARASSLASIPDGQAKIDGIATGDAAAHALIALRANDGSSPPQFKTPGPAVPGEWQATVSCPIVNGVASGIALQWQNITPFGIRSAKEFLLGPPPALRSNEYAKTYNEVMTVGSLDSTERPPDRSDVATYYAATSPTQAFNQAARQIAQEQRRSLSENARALALINMAISDSLVAAFFNKYHYNFWRPETAIHAGDTDGNPKTDPDPNWHALHRDPMFPELSLKPRQRSQCGSGGHETSLRRSWTFDDAVKPRRAHHRPAIHLVQADYQRHQRRSCLRRDPFSNRPGRRSAAGAGCRQSSLQAQPASGAR